MTSAGRAPKLYVILGSHACRTGMLLLEHKGLPYETVTIPSGTQRLLPAFGFPADTVPALVFDCGRKVQGNTALSRALDVLQPEPPLFPAGARLRREVERAEAWGDEVFQPAAKRLAFASALHGPGAMVSDGADGRLGKLLWRRPRSRRVGLRVGALAFDVNERTEAELLAKLPAQLDTIDSWIEAGVLNGEHLYAADYMIATSLALILYRRDLRDEVERRTARALVDRVLPEPAAVPYRG